MKQIYKSKQGVSVLFKPLIFLLILPFIYGVLEPEKFWGSLVFLETTALIFVLPWWYLIYQYWRNDVNQVVAVDLSNGIVTISRSSHSTQFYISEVLECDHVFVRPFNRSLWRDYAYLRIKTAEDTFIITHFTVKPEALINKLNLTYEDKDVFIFPSLDYEKTTDKQRERNLAFHDKKLSEFLIRYDELESEELERIIENKEKYADYAVAAANEILNNRKVKSN